MCFDCVFADNVSDNVAICVAGVTYVRSPKWDIYTSIPQCQLHRARWYKPAEDATYREHPMNVEGRS